MPVMNQLPSYEEYQENVSKNYVKANGSCPVMSVISVLQGKWKLQVIYELIMHNSMRFGELKKALPEITNTMLTSVLKALENDGIVHREQFNEIPPHVEYTLTKKGSDLLPVFYAITGWSLKYGE